MKDLKINVVGVTFENRQEILEVFHRELYVSGKRFGVLLVKEPENKYDVNAVRVQVKYEDSKDVCIGYLPRDINKDVIAFMDEGLISCVLSDINKVADKNIYSATINITVNDEA